MSQPNMNDEANAQFCEFYDVYHYSNIFQFSIREPHQPSYFEFYGFCEVCGVPGHMTVDYQHLTIIAQASALNNFNPCLQNDPFSNMFNQGWHDHPNFSYNNNLPPQYNFAQPSNPYPPFNPNPPDPSETNLKSFMEKFITAQMKENEAMNESIHQLNAKFYSLSAQLITTYEGPMMDSEEEDEKMVNNKDMVVEEDQVDEEVIEKPVVIEEEETPKETVKTQANSKPFQPPTSFPQRLVETKIEHKYWTFLEVLNKFHINKF